MTKIEKLSHDTFYKMHHYSQITIDYVDELEDLLEEDNLEGFEYKLSTVLEVMNPELKYDIEAFNKMIEITNSRKKN